MGFTIWRRSRLNLLGVIVLLVGMGTGDLIYLLARRDDAPSDADVLYEQEQSKAYRGQLERNVGAFGALMAQWEDTIEGLSRPRPLAVTIMVASCVTAAGCFFVASRQPE